jgi:hypothetical protein
VYSSEATTALEITTIGPFEVGRQAPETERHARAFVSPEFLGLGLDAACRLSLRMHEGTEAAPSGGPAAKPPMPLSESDERTLFGTAPALAAFVQGIQATPALSEIFWAITKRPSAWTIVRHGGNLVFSVATTGEGGVVAAAGWPLLGLPVYRMPLLLSFYQEPALRFTLFVTAPRPPLLATAGIVGIIAEPPRAEGKRLEIRLLAGRRAPDQ